MSGVIIGALRLISVVIQRHTFRFTPFTLHNISRECQCLLFRTTTSVALMIPSSAVLLTWMFFLGLWIVYLNSTQRVCVCVEMATNHLLDFRCNFIHITARKLPHHPLLTRNSHQLLRLTWIFRIFIFSQLYLAVWCYRCQLSRPVNVTMHLKLQNLKPNVPVDSMGIFVFLRLSLSLSLDEWKCVCDRQPGI